MRGEPASNLDATFQELQNERRAAGKRYQFIDILTLAICGTICGAEDWSGIEATGQMKEDL